VINGLVSQNQNAFLKNRNIVDGAIIINEVIDFANKSKKECLVFKANFEKAYDFISWSFLVCMLHRYNFGEKWIGWMTKTICG